MVILQRDVEERIVSVKWNDKVTKKWATNITVEADKKDNILLEIISKTTPLNIVIQSINTITYADYLVYDIVLKVDNREQLDKFILDVSQISSVHRVERVMK